MSLIIQVSEIALFLLKKDSSHEKAPPIKIEGFQMSFFDLNQTYQTVFTENY